MQGLLQALTALWGGEGWLPELNRDELDVCNFYSRGVAVRLLCSGGNNEEGIVDFGSWGSTVGATWRIVSCLG